MGIHCSSAQPFTCAVRNFGTTSIRRKSRKKEGGGLRDRRRALGAPAGLRLPPFFLSPQKSTGKGREKGPTSKTAKSGSCRNMVR